MSTRSRPIRTTPTDRPSGSARRQAGSDSSQRSKTQSNFTLLIGLFRRHLVLLLFPVGLFSTLAAAYVLTREPTWKATQSLQIRDELAIQTVMPGRFDSLDMMKMVQETMHETVRRHAVVGKVLSQLNPPADYEDPAQWPSVEDIEGMQGAISLTPPNGAQFGRTEILLLSANAGTVERAKKFVGLLAKELQNQLNELRDKRAGSIENELKESVRLTTEDLEKANLELANFEKNVGEILVDLRSISHDTGSGSTAIHSNLSRIEVETRVARQKFDVISAQLKNIQKAAIDPKHVLSFSSELLAAQPTLQKLKEELVRIQAKTAQTLGQFEPYHAKSKAAKEAERLVELKIRDEIQSAAKGLKSQADVAQGEIDRLVGIEQGYQKQLQRLAEVRAPYTSLVKLVQQKRDILNKGMEELARARASRVAAKTTNLITLLDEPYSGSRPEGTSKKLIIAAAGLAGLLSGVGLVFFAASPSFVGPMNNEEDSNVNLPGWKAEALGVNVEPTQAETEQRVPPRSSRVDSRPKSNVSHPQDLEIRRVDFEEEEEYDVDLDAIFNEMREEESVEKTGQDQVQQRHSEPFSLEPKKNEGMSGNTSSHSDSNFSDTLRSDLDESGEDPSRDLQEKHRRQIENMFRDE